jgi:hypothetical protein
VADEILLESPPVGVVAADRAPMNITHPCKQAVTAL